MLKLKLQYPGHLMWRTNSLEKMWMLGKTEGERRRGMQRLKWLNSIAGSMDMSLSKLQETVKDRKAWRVVVHEVRKSQTWLSDWTTTKELGVRNSDLYSQLSEAELTIWSCLPHLPDDRWLGFYLHHFIMTSDSALNLNLCELLDLGIIYCFLKCCFSKWLWLD